MTLTRPLHIFLSHALQDKPVAGSTSSQPVTSSSGVVSTGVAPGGHAIYIFGGLEFVKIPASDFNMGANDINNYEGACKPQHLVCQLDYDFYMARFPVTNRQYSQIAREGSASVIVSKEKVQHPVVNVSWYDTQKYIERLNKKYQAELPEGFRFCLPSEAEWEKAARGPDGSEYPWGDNFDKNKCNTYEGEKGDTTPVDAYTPNGDSPYGCADMAGNVWEWTRSLWGNELKKPQFEYPYRFDDKRDDEDADGSVRRVLRGGSFHSFEAFARCAFRSRGYPHGEDDDIGFRVAVSHV